ncbi:MAG TPA: hypothetical protein PLV58_05160, partial [Campylobacterales bacterium]|nr:hypothetical protein [Campylobacterales bacterium]
LPNKMFFIAGQIGNGKTTFLNMLGKKYQKVANKYEFFHIYGRETFLHSDVDIIDILLIIGSKIASANETTKKRYISLLEKMQDVKDEVYEEIETISSKGESSVIAKAKITLGARFFSILKANADFESVYKVNDEMRKDARKFFKLRRNELIELINSIILSYKMEQNNGKELAIIIDDLEKSKNIDELYMEDINILERLNLLKIISMPIYLKRNNTDAREFALKLKKRDQTPNEKDLTLLRKVIDFRVENKTLISEKAVNLAIEYSGANLRQLIKLVHFAAEYALAFESAEIGEKEMLNAIERVGRDFSEQARHMSSFLLEISEHKWYVEESEENRAKLTKATNNELVFAYFNGDVWYDINPLIEKTLKRQAAR